MSSRIKVIRLKSLKQSTNKNETIVKVSYIIKIFLHPKNYQVKAYQ